MDERFQDWLFRYGYMLKKRRSKKGKQRFLQALVMDLKELRDDISVIAYHEANYHSRNVYVGNIETAKKVVCTYYDTPLLHTGAYILFDRKEQRKKTTIALLIGIAIMLSIGLLGTLFYMKTVSDPFNLNLLSTYMVILAYLLYFFILAKTAKGLSYKSTLVRNTSSILTMLKMISEVNDEDIAYAFVDEGCFKEEGRNAIAKQTRKDCKFYCLDSVGANQDLHSLENNEGSQELEYIFAARKNEQVYSLLRGDLKDKTLSMRNIEEVISMIKK